MQYRTMQLIAIVLISNSLFADEAISLSDKVDRTNYAIGQQIGQDFRKQNMDLDPEALSRGMNDGHAGKQPELKPAEMRELLVNLKRQITKDMKADAMAKMKHRQTEKQRRLKAGSEFLEKNRALPDVVTTGSGLQYKIIKPGSGTQPTKDDQVKLHYVSRRLDSQVFYSTHLKGGPKTHRVGELIPGMSEALQLMQPGAKWELYIPHQLAYGRNGPVAHETVIIEVELLETAVPPSQASK
ncbi:MAG: FKBP-type peptidyl-prolyl cis-trans isomerase [Candidatus Thiodiazotropha weberae]|nr:FKBP-type peptidyl-prolyl cis-trans isomerase N-terminal domain-containing protein [Candidatus Thiodiazotropha endoloripes]MCG7900323.1 FKBP-type peptidyl-prolyl cis-trans isomerase [Candidatus Thiodiazotropha weberae]